MEELSFLFYNAKLNCYLELVDQVVGEQLRCHTPKVGSANPIHQAVDSLPQGVLAETLVLLRASQLRR